MISKNQASGASVYATLLFQTLTCQSLPSFSLVYGRSRAIDFLPALLDPPLQQWHQSWHMLVQNEKQFIPINLNIFFITSESICSETPNHE